MKRIMWILIIIPLCLTACWGDGGDDYNSDYIHRAPSPPVREHKEFAGLAGVTLLVFLGLKRTKTFRILLVLVLLLGLIACRGSGGKGPNEGETSDDNGVYYIMGRGFDQKEFAILLTMTLLIALRQKLVGARNMKAEMMNRNIAMLIWTIMVVLVIPQLTANAQGPTDLMYEVKTRDGKRLCLYSDGTWGPAIHDDKWGWECPPESGIGVTRYLRVACDADVSPNIRGGNYKWTSGGS